MTTGRSSDEAGAPPRRSGRSSRPSGPATSAASSSTSSTEAVEAGRIGRPHGLDGSFHVTRPEPDLLVDRLSVAGIEREVTRRAGTADAPILRLEGITSRDAIAELRGEPLWVPRAAAPPLDEDEFWAQDLAGCAVVDGERRVGEVDRVLAYPSCEVLVVGELLVPLVDDAVRTVDLDARVIDVSLEFLGAG